jgi:hypothetical protein
MSMGPNPHWYDEDYEDNDELKEISVNGWPAEIIELIYSQRNAASFA